MIRRVFYLTFTAAAIAIVLASSASAFNANNTSDPVWRAFNSTAGPDRLGNSITNGDLAEILWRWGNENGSVASPAVINSTTYNSLSTSIKAMLDRVRNPATGAISNNQLSLFNAKEFNAESKVASVTATDSQMAGMSSLFKLRAGASLAPKLLSTGAIVFTTLQYADLVERAIVAGENKVFGWHVNLKGPFGIFGSWSPTGTLSANEGSVIIDGAKWKTVTTTALCSAGTTSGCPTFDIVMNAETGGSVGSLDPACSCDKLFVLEPHRTVKDTFGTIVSSATGYVQSMQNIYPCTQGTAYYNAWSTNVSGSCNEGSVRASIMVDQQFREVAPGTIPSATVKNGGSCVCEQTVMASSTGWQSGSSIATGQWVSTGNCTSGISTACVAFTMTEGQMERYLGMRNTSGHVTNWAYEKPATSETTNIQGCADADQPCSTFNPTIAAPTSVQTDTQRGTIQSGARDGADDNASNWGDCWAAGNGGSGQTCPSPWEDGYVVPSGCIGVAPSVCVSALQTAGFSGNHVDTLLGKDSAVITLPAGAVATMDPSQGATVNPDTIFSFELNPTPLPIELPQRLNGNEVATDYATRLATSGYTGTVTYVVLDPSAIDPNAGPGAVTFPISDITTGETLQPGDRIEPGDNLTIYKNPDTVPPVTVGGGGFTCSCPPIDFSPLQTIGLGSKFPFGIFTYAAGIIGNFNVSPHAPDFSFTAQATGVNGHNLSAPYDVNLGDTGTNRVGNSLNTYMGYWRDLLSFCMWAGAIFFVGRKLLGYEGGGDPGEAVDEVL